MKQITTVEVIKDGEIVFTSPFDIVPAGTVQTVDELKQFLTNIAQVYQQNAPLIRLQFLLEIKFYGFEFKIGKQNWKWDKDYFLNFKSSGK